MIKTPPRSKTESIKSKQVSDDEDYLFEPQNPILRQRQTPVTSSSIAQFYSRQSSSLLMKSKVKRYRPSLSKGPILIPRYLKLTKTHLLYSKHQGQILLSLPLQDISYAKPLYQPQLDIFFFEIVLKQHYEHLYLQSYISQHQDETPNLSRLS